VKSSVGEFSSGVSICPNKGPQTVLGTHFNQGRPVGGTGTFLKEDTSSNRAFQL